jgi:dihydrofolate reductase
MPAANDNNNNKDPFMHIRNLSLIVAMTDRGVIGRDGKLPWSDIVDAKWFREKTVHRSLIMGRKTYDAIMAHNGQPLDRRTSVVLSTRKWNETWPSDGVDPQGTRWARNPLEALDMAAWGWNGGGTTEAMVIGGAKVYEIFFPFANTIYLTLIEGEYAGDVVFPGGVPGLPTWQHEGGPLKFDGFTCHTLCRALAAHQS